MFCFWLYSHLAPINCQYTVVGNDKEGDDKITGSVYIRWTYVEDDKFFDGLMPVSHVQSGARVYEVDGVRKCQMIAYEICHSVLASSLPDLWTLDVCPAVAASWQDGATLELLRAFNMACDKTHQKYFPSVSN